MSSKRGRKRNDNLPPNRARDVQRAFRARRAAHLQALEHRVIELEEENNYLRQALNLPPSNRSPLGRGPTGKDKPKDYSARTPDPLSFDSTRESSFLDSPPSRASSESPTGAIPVSMSPSRPMTVIDNSWDDTMLMNNPHATTDSPLASDSAYQLAPMGPLPMKQIQYAAYTNSIASSSRNPLSNNIYHSSTANYSHSSDRPLTGDYAPHSYPIRTEIREEVPRTHYSYVQAPYQTQDSDLHVHNHSQSPSPSAGNYSHPHSQPQPQHTQSHSHHLQPLHQPQSQPPQSHHDPQRDSPLPYPHRRNLPDPHGFPMAQSYPPMPNPVQIQPNPRPHDYSSRAQAINHPLRSPFGPDGRLHPMS